MEWLKLNEDGEIEIQTEEVKLVPEVQAIMTLKYNKGKGDVDGRKRVRALNELKYLYLAYSPRSPYKDFTTTERIAEAKSDCNFTDDWKESPELEALVPKFKKGSVSKISRMLETVNEFVEKFEMHLRTLDLNERNGAGGYVNNPKDVIATLKQLPDLATTLQELEIQAKFDTIKTVGARGDQEPGWMAMKKPNNKVKQTEEDGEPTEE